MTRRSRGCQSSSRYGAYNRSFVSALTIAGEALGVLHFRCAFQQKSTSRRVQEVATMPAYERRQVQGEYPRRAILGWENEPRTSPSLVRCRMRSEGGDFGDHIDDAVLCVPTLSTEQKA